MRIRVALHRFDSDPALPQRDGVNLAHGEINRLMDEEFSDAIDARFHDFDRLLREPVYAREELTDIDCVLCNVGPHAHYYHRLREQLGLAFRIVRDIKTALWSGYLLQESLCQPFLRPDDALLATSHYSRALTRRLFPHLRDHPIALFEPVLSSAREQLPYDAPHPSPGKPLTLGYLGRLSEDKNFPQVVDLLLELHRREPGRYRLLAVGAVHSPSCTPEAIADRVNAATGRSDLFDYRPPVPHDDVPQVLREFDYLLFFSTSNLEVLGRVLVEADFSGVPVLAADHAAAPELLDATSLLPVTYAQDQPFHSHFDAPLGAIDVVQAADRIASRSVPRTPPRPLVNHPETLLRVLRGDPVAPAGALGLAQRAMLDQLQGDALPAYPSQEAAEPVVALLQDWFLALNGRRGADFAERLAQLECLSPFKERTRRFIAASASTRCDFTNLGGIDIELCNVAGYHPRFWLGAK